MEIRRYCHKDIDLDLVSMVDMMLLILIFFILTSSFLPLYNIEVNLPVVKEGISALPSRPLIITLTRQGETYLEGEKLSAEDIVGRLFLRFGEQWKKKELLLKVDKDARSEDLLRLIDSLRRGGAAKINVLSLQSK